MYPSAAAPGRYGRRSSYQSIGRGLLSPTAADIVSAAIVAHFTLDDGKAFDVRVLLTQIQSSFHKEIAGFRTKRRRPIDTLDYGASFED
ncbi:hypothetical protein EOA32_34550 [Mesorhizobium sp. M1A.F.Ca.ET.072.01.1.1]|uniref:hypothetical protein n=1 Tax=Mesorhizobium sp. M1A.F.Ca.ET.072.01.1.1 TaxID=2496753 RepID=UPI000FD581BE|nr:hypothetical protein [Mesorhizobium sp. M1A.F.Ca.ET.072.01.1.1]RUW45279.1 hypothetical protein EOA32_34550 [Mesorhizobium sp. M1A.F.Ca.ET.072.01.1.1]TIU97642.1 MAG: hypothetical protein E5W04_25530 [Mesorhizobium sp.]